MTSRLVLLLLVSFLVLLPLLSTAALSEEYLEYVDEDDAIFEHEVQAYPHEFDQLFDYEFEDEDEDFDNYDDFEVPKIDEKDVVVLKDENFSEFIENNRYVMVEFYAPWCRHCQELAPEYAAAATELNGEAVALAKVDVTKESELAEKYEVLEFPTVYFFIDGDHNPYSGQRTKNAIITWIKKRIGPGVYNISTEDDAEHVLTSENKVVLGFLNSLVGPESEELAAASRLEDDVNFYQTVNPDVAKLFHMDLNVKRPALVMLKEAEKLSHFDGQFKKSAIVEFVFANKFPLVTNFTRENGPMIFESPIKKQLLLFSTSNDSEKVFPTFQDAAKLFKGKLIFVYLEMDNEDVGIPVLDYFGIAGNAPRVLAYTGNDDAKKYVLDGEVTLDKIKAFSEDFLEDKLKPSYKSDPVPETISVDTDRTVVAFYKFLKKHASILFKLQKPSLSPKSEGSDTKESIDGSSTNDLKDEL